MNINLWSLAGIEPQSTIAVADAVFSGSQSFERF